MADEQAEQGAVAALNAIFLMGKNLGTVALLLAGALWTAANALGVGEPPPPVPPAVTLKITHHFDSDRKLVEYDWTFQEQRFLRQSVEDGIVPAPPPPPRSIDVPLPTE